MFIFQILFSTSQIVKIINRHHVLLIEGNISKSNDLIFSNAIVLIATVTANINDKDTNHFEGEH